MAPPVSRSRRRSIDGRRRMPGRVNRLAISVLAQARDPRRDHVLRGGAPVVFDTVAVRFHLPSPIGDLPGGVTVHTSGSERSPDPLPRRDPAGRALLRRPPEDIRDVTGERTPAGLVDPPATGAQLHAPARRIYRPRGGVSCPDRLRPPRPATAQDGVLVPASDLAVESGRHLPWTASVPRPLGLCKLRSRCFGGRGSRDSAAPSTHGLTPDPTRSA